ncbi:hypothetical protein WDW37_01745 [Bdellovibrionota bacterium FG-1]
MGEIDQGVFYKNPVKGMSPEIEWLPLMEYAIKSGVSLSTLRRYIKANKILYKVENGRYLLSFSEKPFHAPERDLDVKRETDAQTMRLQLLAAQEEIAELKMLVAIYEEQLNSPLSTNG